jgi:hypothetical protein
MRDVDQLLRARQAAHVGRSNPVCHPPLLTLATRRVRVGVGTAPPVAIFY